MSLVFFPGFSLKKGCLVLGSGRLESGQVVHRLKFEAGTFTKWKRFCGIGFEKDKRKMKPEHHKKFYDCNIYTFEKLMKAGDVLLERLKAIEEGNRTIKSIHLKNASMNCNRVNHPG